MFKGRQKTFLRIDQYQFPQFCGYFISWVAVLIILILISMKGANEFQSDLVPLNWCQNFLKFKGEDEGKFQIGSYNCLSCQTLEGRDIKQFNLKFKAILKNVQQQLPNDLEFKYQMSSIGFQKSSFQFQCAQLAKLSSSSAYPEITNNQDIFEGHSNSTDEDIQYLEKFKLKLLENNVQERSFFQCRYNQRKMECNSNTVVNKEVEYVGYAFLFRIQFNSYLSNIEKIRLNILYKNKEFEKQKTIFTIFLLAMNLCFIIYSCVELCGLESIFKRKVQKWLKILIILLIFYNQPANFFSIDSVPFKIADNVLQCTFIAVLLIFWINLLLSSKRVLLSNNFKKIINFLKLFAVMFYVTPIVIQKVIVGNTQSSASIQNEENTDNDSYKQAQKLKNIGLATYCVMYFWLTFLFVKGKKEKMQINLEEDYTSENENNNKQNNNYQNSFEIDNDNNNQNNNQKKRHNSSNSGQKILKKEEFGEEKDFQEEDEKSDNMNNSFNNKNVTMNSSHMVMRDQEDQQSELPFQQFSDLSSDKKKKKKQEFDQDQEEKNQSGVINDGQQQQQQKNENNNIICTLSIIVFILYLVFSAAASTSQESIFSEFSIKILINIYIFILIPLYVPIEISYNSYEEELEADQKYYQEQMKNKVLEKKQNQENRNQRFLESESQLQIDESFDNAQKQIQQRKKRKIEDKKQREKIEKNVNFLKNPHNLAIISDLQCNRAFQYNNQANLQQQEQQQQQIQEDEVEDYQFEDTRQQKHIFKQKDNKKGNNKNNYQAQLNLNQQNNKQNNLSKNNNNKNQQMGYQDDSDGDDGQAYEDYKVDDNDDDEDNDNEAVKDDYENDQQYNINNDNNENDAYYNDNGSEGMENNVDETEFRNEQYSDQNNSNNDDDNEEEERKSNDYNEKNDEDDIDDLD